MVNLNKKTQYFSAKRLAMLAVLCAMGLLMFMVESLFPPLFLPGAKMGLSNIFSLLTVILFGPTDAFVLVVVRTTLGSMFTGNMSTLLYSMTAGIVSVTVSSLLVEFLYPKISIVAISVVSAVMHNLTQNVVFCLISNTPEMFSYMPWLAVLGVVAGVIVGFAVWFILRTVPLRTFASVLGVSAEDFSLAYKQNDRAPTCENLHNTDIATLVAPQNVDKAEDLQILSVPCSVRLNSSAKGTVANIYVSQIPLRIETFTAANGSVVVDICVATNDCVKISVANNK